MGGPAIRQAGAFYRVSTGSRKLHDQILTCSFTATKELRPSASGSALNGVPTSLH